MTSFRIKPLAARTVAQMWSASFRLLSWLRPRPVKQWYSPGGIRVLVVAPHPDDEVIGCGGAMLLHRGRGDRVYVAHLTDGRRSRAGGLGPEQMAEQRRREAAKAAGLLAVDREEWLGLPEGAWHEADLIDALCALIDRYQPQIIYGPSRVDFHPEHCHIAYCLASALARCPPEFQPSVVRVYQVQVPLTARLTNLVAPLHSVGRAVSEAASAYVTQQGPIGAGLRAKRYAASRHGIGAEAEAFWELTREGYCALHRNCCTPRQAGPFRSIRDGPWADPFAYLCGRGERRRLAELARA